MVNSVHIEAVARRLAFGRMADGRQGKWNYLRQYAKQLAHLPYPLHYRVDAHPDRPQPLGMGSKQKVLHGCWLPADGGAIAPRSRSSTSRAMP